MVRYTLVYNAADVVTSYFVERLDEATSNGNHLAVDVNHLLASVVLDVPSAYSAIIRDVTSDQLSGVPNINFLAFVALVQFIRIRNGDVVVHDESDDLLVQGFSLYLVLIATSSLGWDDTKMERAWRPVSEYRLFPRQETVAANICFAYHCTQLQLEKMGVFDVEHSWTHFVHRQREWPIHVMESFHSPAGGRIMTAVDALAEHV